MNSPDDLSNLTDPRTIRSAGGSKERLLVLIEDLSKLQYIASRILQFGYDVKCNDNKATNRELLSASMRNTLKTILLFIDHEDVK